MLPSSCFFPRFCMLQMTVAEATEIADNALEHSVRCILQAVQVWCKFHAYAMQCVQCLLAYRPCWCQSSFCQTYQIAARSAMSLTLLSYVFPDSCCSFGLQAQEVLRSSRGALMWHGRDLRHFKRIISPPLQQLLTQPGTAVLGRGLASMPAASAHQMGAAQVGDVALFFSDIALSRCNQTVVHVGTCQHVVACLPRCLQALMHLASDAVRAAGESPFLDGALQSASGVLCAINLPPNSQLFHTGSGTTAVLQGIQVGKAGSFHFASLVSCKE